MEGVKAQLGQPCPHPGCHLPTLCHGCSASDLPSPLPMLSQPWVLLQAIRSGPEAAAGDECWAMVGPVGALVLSPRLDSEAACSALLGADWGGQTWTWGSGRLKVF